MVRRIGAWLRGNVLAVVMAVALAAAVAGVSTAASAHRAELEGQEARISELSALVSGEEADRTAQIDTEMSRATGVDRGRVVKDRRTIDQLLQTAFTWSGGMEYAEARDALMRTYGLGEDDLFMSLVMPPSTYSTDADGNRYYYIDSVGLTSAVGVTSVMVERVRATDYTYLVVVTTDITSSAVSAGDVPAAALTGHTDVLIEVTVGADGSVTGLRGWAPTEQTRTG